MLPPLTAGFFCKKNADSLEFKLVCLIIDANMANKFAPTPDDDVKPVIRWLTDSRSRGQIANGGKLRRELEKAGVEFHRFLHAERSRPGDRKG